MLLIPALLTHLCSSPPLSWILSQLITCSSALLCLYSTRYHPRCVRRGLAPHDDGLNHLSTKHLALPPQKKLTGATW
ncbi:hypothetical protein DEU56DRAFT_79465 [Suillus clintonianus]|uniref:uncharacterized protein n=1 Tax=Suillus clintonianus TaxID=1904413 RepID=UPI001B865987|nr:uncharacterized protein DEU56DRAFT_79465 [Suillus clintonianus]KAG2122136.1 hypothetical protein DEU56DRAFT_79465 [Suillus clintonianus]